MYIDKKALYESFLSRGFDDACARLMAGLDPSTVMEAKDPYEEAQKRIEQKKKEIEGEYNRRTHDFKKNVNELKGEINKEYEELYKIVENYRSDEDADKTQNEKENVAKTESVNLSEAIIENGMNQKQEKSTTQKQNGDNEQAEEIKYELTNKAIKFEGRTLYQIRALRDINNHSGGLVKRGQFGGWIESENNLEQSGDCWVFPKAKVYDNAKVSEEACVSGAAAVYGDAEVSVFSEVRDYAKIYGNAFVGESARIGENARVYDQAQVRGKAQVFGNAWIFDQAHIDGDKVMVYGKARVHDNARVLGTAQVGGTADLGEGVELRSEKVKTTEEVNNLMKSSRNKNNIQNYTDDGETKSVESNNHVESDDNLEPNNENENESKNDAQNTETKNNESGEYDGERDNRNGSEGNAPNNAEHNTDNQSESDNQNETDKSTTSETEEGYTAGSPKSLDGSTEQKDKEQPEESFPPADYRIGNGKTVGELVKDIKANTYKLLQNAVEIANVEAWSLWRIREVALLQDRATEEALEAEMENYSEVSERVIYQVMFGSDGRGTRLDVFRIKQFRDIN